MDQSNRQREQIGLLFLSSYTMWTGGIIYILNLIRALNLLDDAQKPELLIFHGHESPLEDIESIRYPYIQFHQVNSKKLFTKIYLKVKRIVTGKSAFYSLLPEVVYPYNKYIFLGKTPINWIPDFQEWYLPQMFSKAEIVKRKQHQQSIVDQGGIVIFSSQSAMNDFKKFFPENKCTLRLLRFASILPPLVNTEISTKRKQYGIEKTYFMCPNQFWAHKNHIVVLKAIKLLSQYNLDYQIAFTGSQDDYRNKDHFKTLTDFVQLNGIQRWVKFLGFIDRQDQLTLMKNARAIIQPSLFEGWSTVVEDAKALNQYLILSEIPVHKEQIEDNCNFFIPDDPVALAELIHSTILQKPQVVEIDYSQNIKSFSEDIINVLKI
jgi:glycosyltransferase involved in cell wall biosynthesis